MSIMMKNHFFRLSLFLLLPLPLVVGCGPRGPHTIPVEGTVTFGGGPWPKPGFISFTTEAPTEEALYRPVLGEFDTHGTLSVGTFAKGDGLLPGKYRIGIECWEVPPNMGPKPPKSYVPQRFRTPATSGFTVTVEPDQKVVTIKLDVAKK